MTDVTICITSCDRHDLLKRTLDSLKTDAPILICEDGPTPCPGWLMADNLGYITKPHRRGQIHSADLLMMNVKTPYVFWCEDDWVLHQPFNRVVEVSRAILEAHPSVFTVNLRGDQCNGHPLVTDPRFPFKIQQLDWHGFGSFNFNPGLRRLSDYQKMGTYASLCGPVVPGAVNERNLSIAYQNAGYVIASPSEQSVCEHIGHGRSRAVEKF